VIVVAGGAGRRFGGAKQFIDLAGRSVLERSVATARTLTSHVVVVVPAASLDASSIECGAELAVAGGADRAASVRAGLAAVPERAEVIVVHDAARPLATPSLFAAVVDALAAGAAGAVPALDVIDTIKRVRSGLVVETLDRSELVAIQTPQAFTATALRAAHASGRSATDDAALVESDGAPVVVVAGEVRNIKITDPRDLTTALRYLEEIAKEVVG
jgi:2-C-methyl-D-erythritol 4-phosphate cytidylyltransferase